MADRPPDWFQKGLSNMEDYMESDSEESRSVRIRNPTVRYADSDLGNR